MQCDCVAVCQCSEDVCLSVQCDCVSLCLSVQCGCLSVSVVSALYLFLIFIEVVGFEVKERKAEADR